MRLLPSYQRSIQSKVMIEILIAHGVKHAGWYGRKALEAKFHEVCGNFMNGGHGRRFSEVSQPGYLPGDRKAPSYKAKHSKPVKKQWWEDLGL